RKEHFLREKIEELEAEMMGMREQHRAELEKASLKARGDALIETARAGGLAHAAHLAATGAQPTQTRVDESPKLGKVVKDFLDNFRRDKKGPMFTKHKTVLPLFVMIVGDKKVSQLKQADVNEFFEVVQKLPPRWSDEVRKR